jgi:hypothetical protein
MMVVCCFRMAVIKMKGLFEVSRIRRQVMHGRLRYHSRREDICLIPVSVFKGLGHLGCVWHMREVLTVY